MKRLKRGALASFLILLSVSGCSQHGVSEEAKSTTPEEARSRTVHLYEVVTRAIPSAEWSETGKWVSCGEFDGDYYVKWTAFAQLLQGTIKSPEEVADLIADEWRRLGLDPVVTVDASAKSETFVASDPPFLGGVHGDGSLTQLFVSNQSVAFSADSLCVPGDVLQLNPDPTPTVTPPSSP